MMNKLIFGRYMPGDSLIHRLDPRAKLLASFYFIGIIFLANNWQTYALLAVFKGRFQIFHPRHPSFDLVDFIYSGTPSIIY